MFSPPCNPAFSSQSLPPLFSSSWQTGILMTALWSWLITCSCGTLSFHEYLLRYRRICCCEVIVGDTSWPGWLVACTLYIEITIDNDFFRNELRTVPCWVLNWLILTFQSDCRRQSVALLASLLANLISFWWRFASPNDFTSPGDPQTASEVLCMKLVSVQIFYWYYGMTIL